MKIIKKLLKYFYYLITFGYGAYLAFRKERKKLLALYECFEGEFKRSQEICSIISDITQKIATTPASINDVLPQLKNLAKHVGPEAMKHRIFGIQTARQVWNDIKKDLEEINS